MSELQDDSDESTKSSSDKIAEEEIVEEDLHVPLLDPLSDVDLVTLVDGLQTEVKHLRIENMVFENFLKKSEPSLLEGMEEKIKATAGLCAKSPKPDRSSIVSRTTSRASLEPRKLSTTQGNVSPVLPTNSVKSVGSIAEKGPKINLSQRTELVLKQMEETQNELDKLLKKSQKQKNLIEAMTEELRLRLVETNEAIAIFEQTVVIESVDPLTQKIPAEKFLRYMHEWLKSAQTTIDKLRLRTSTLKSQYKKLEAQYNHKILVGEKLHKVDFEQLEIENGHLIEQIEQKTKLLIEMKQIYGTANLALSISKNILLEQMEEMKTMKNKIAVKEKKIGEMDATTDKIAAQVDRAREKYAQIKRMVHVYECPDVLDYVRLKAELNTSRKTLKMWSRRKHLKDVSLNICVMEMKQLTGSKFDRSWFRFPNDSRIESTDSSEYSVEDTDSLKINPNIKP